MRARYRMISTIAVGVLGSIVPQAGFGDGPGVPVASPRITVTGDPTPIETIRTALLAAAPQIVPEAGTLGSPCDRRSHRCNPSRRRPAPCSAPFKLFFFCTYSTAYKILGPCRR
jgi:hypothetical protein